MSLYYKYYLEIKNRFILVFISWLSLLTICYIYKEPLLFTLMSFSTHSKLLNTKPYFIFTNVTEIFYVYLELVLFIANQISLFIICYHILMFLALGLYDTELNKLKFAFKFFVIAWVGTIILLYKFVIPFSWSFFLSFQQNSQTVQPISFLFEAKIEEYFSYLKSLYYICLVNSQFLAIVTFFLASLSEKLKKIKTLRKLFYLIFIIFSTITTPPDVISQIIMSGFLVVTYETIVFIQYLKTSMVTN